jgi:succinate dehydrogenase hydrophobic anchor subunit
MVVILSAFTLFHLAVGLACLAVAIRMWTPGERALWRSPAALLAAEFLVWLYPIFAFVGVRVAWRAFNAGDHLALPIILAPIGWLIVMGIVYAIVDFAEDGVLGNARARSP